MHNDQEITALMQRFVPIAADMGAALWNQTSDGLCWNALRGDGRSHLRLCSDIRGDGLQRVVLQVIHTASGECMKNVVTIRVGPDLRVTKIDAGRLKNAIHVEPVLARYVPESKYVAGDMFGAVEERESALMETADDFVQKDEARYRMETDFLPGGAIARLVVAWCGLEQTSHYPVPLIVYGPSGLVKLPAPTPELRERFAWLFDAIPSRN